MKGLKGLAPFALCFFFSTAALANFSGEVVRILDGDTVEVLVEKRPVRVRLADIDAPEKKQPFGTKSTQALAALIFRQHVQVIDHGKDATPTKRTLGTIMLGTKNVNAQMVAAGMAWAYRYKGQPTNPDMAKLEAQAKQQRVGLWADKNPVEPWMFRRMDKK